MIACDQNQSCIGKVAEKYKAIDDIQDEALANCRTIACVGIHLKEIEDAKKYLLENDYVVELAEYSLDAASRINARQEGLFFSQALTEVEAGGDLRAVAYCERSPGPNCKLLGGILADISDGLTNVAYAKLAAAGASGQLVADDVALLEREIASTNRDSRWTSEQVTTAKRLGVSPKWIESDGQIRWPPNDGFAGASQNSTLQPGTLIDRYGKSTGSFLAPAGTPFEQRALPTISATDTYTKYIVVKPLPVQAGPAAPWFDQPGGGLQFKTQMSVQELLDGGFLSKSP